MTDKKKPSPAPKPKPPQSPPRPAKDYPPEPRESPLVGFDYDIPDTTKPGKNG